jgi:hypothetical protein
MTETTQSVQTRVLVIPRQLEEFFYERLTRRFVGRDDVRVIVDRRAGQRRQQRWVSGPGPLADRRHGERRDATATWRLADMPVGTTPSDGCLAT